MTFDELVARFGLPLAMLVVVTLAFVRGAIVPRFIYDQERQARIESEQRFDRAITLAESLLQEIRKRKGDRST